LITLTIDIGNTNTKLYWFNDSGAIVHRWRKETQEGVDAEALASTPTFQRAILGSVVPHFSPLWLDWAKGRCAQVHLASAQSPWSFQSAVEAPEKVGVDRLANLEALSKEPQSALVVDAGTATKIDLLEGMGSRRTFPGGAIAPGLAIGYEALMARTAQLIEVNWDMHSPVIGYNTETAIRSGLLHGFASMVDGMIIRIFAERKLPQSTPVWVTGGFGRYLEGRANFCTGYRPDLTAEGLYELSKKL
jgi:type III pantothenate kinase